MSIVTATRTGRAPPKLEANSGQRAEGVSTKIREDEDQGHVSSEGVENCSLQFDN